MVWSAVFEHVEWCKRHGLSPETVLLGSGGSREFAACGTWSIVAEWLYFKALEHDEHTLEQWRNQSFTAIESQASACQLDEDWRDASDSNSQCMREQMAVSQAEKG